MNILRELQALETLALSAAVVAEKHRTGVVRVDPDDMARSMAEARRAFWEPFVRQAHLAGEIRAELDPTSTASWVVRSLFALAIMTSAKPSQREMKEIRDYARTFIAGGLAYAPAL